MIPKIQQSFLDSFFISGSKKCSPVVFSITFSDGIGHLFPKAIQTNTKLFSSIQVSLEHLTIIVNDK